MWNYIFGFVSQEIFLPRTKCIRRCGETCQEREKKEFVFSINYFDIYFEVEALADPIKSVEFFRSLECPDGGFVVNGSGDGAAIGLIQLCRRLFMDCGGVVNIGWIGDSRKR